MARDNFSMFSTDSGIFIQFIGGTSNRVLHPAKITVARASSYAAEFDETDVALQPGQDVLVYYRLNRKFVQQSARVDAILQTAPTGVIAFQLVGQPVSAESRQCYRVSTVTTGMAARLGEEESCLLQEVSATGFAVLAKALHDVGSLVDAELRYQADRFTGRARVQSIKQLRPGRIRYGLHCIDDKSGGGNLLKGVQHISAAVQQRQLRRRAGST